MFTLTLHEDAENDLEALKRSDPAVAAEIFVLLEEIESDQELLDSLTIKNYGANRSAKFHVDWFWEHWKLNIDLWRIKYWKLEDLGLKYRILYAYLRGKREYVVLGITHRDWDYDKDHEFTKRILSAYDSL